MPGCIFHNLSSVRDFKHQLVKDTRRVFLNLGEFGELKRILYWRGGRGNPPEDRRIPACLCRDENMNSVWNKMKNQQRTGNDQVLYQMERFLFCSQSDFSPPPRKNRYLQVDDHTYEVLGVTVEEGMLKVELRELDE